MIAPVGNELDGADSDDEGGAEPKDEPTHVFTPFVSRSKTRAGSDDRRNGCLRLAGMGSVGRRRHAWGTETASPGGVPATARALQAELAWSVLLLASVFLGQQQDGGNGAIGLGDDPDASAVPHTDHVVVNSDTRQLCGLYDIAPLVKGLTSTHNHISL